MLHSPYLIVGSRRIAKILGISRSYLYKHIDQGDFPVRKLQDGRYATTYGLIDEWIRAGWLANARLADQQIEPEQTLPAHCPASGDPSTA